MRKYSKYSYKYSDIAKNIVSVPLLIYLLMNVTTIRISDNKEDSSISYSYMFFLGSKLVLNPKKWQ